MWLITDTFNYFSHFSSSSPACHDLQKGQHCTAKWGEAVLAKKRGQESLLPIAFELPHFALSDVLLPEYLFWLYQRYHIIYSVEWMLN